MIWLSGEITDLRIPTSGHAYFNLKDEKARIAAVMFRGQRNHLKFKLADGESIIGLGRISVYEPRGTYQIILEYAEPQGAGALQLSFEQLKNKLDQEGLFSNEHKRAIPFLPRTVCAITSPTGAAIRDIIHVIQRRYPNAAIELLPVKVQGEGAAEQIAHAIHIANRRHKADVLIVARGGGSIEDLAPFNSEVVARAIFGSELPVVTGIGHEIDYTIADFVADLRAPTPSAAAELVFPVKNELKLRCLELRQRCIDSFDQRIARHRDKLSQMRRSLIHPIKRIQDRRLRTDDLLDRLKRAANTGFRRQKDQLRLLYSSILRYNPISYIQLNKSNVKHLESNLLKLMNNNVFNNKNRLSACYATLMALSPQAVLERGYSITRTVPEGNLVTSSKDVYSGQMLEIQVSQGKLRARTE